MQIKHVDFLSDRKTFFAIEFIILIFRISF